MKNLRSLRREVLFLIRPVWKHGRLLVILMFISSIVALPLGLLASVSVAQAVIDRILAGGTLLSVLGVIGVYFLIYAVSSVMQDGLRVFYQGLQQMRITRSIAADIFRQALRTDYRWLDDPAYFQQLTMVLQKFPGDSFSSVLYLTQIASGAAGSIAMIGVISRTGLLLALIVTAFLVASMLLTARAMKISLEEYPAAAKIDHRTDYVVQIYRSPGCTAELKSTLLAEKLERFYESGVKEYLKRYWDIVRRSGLLSIGSDWVRKLADYAVILYAAVGLLTGRVESVGVFATLIAAAAALSSCLSNIAGIGTVLVRTRETARMLRSFFELDSPIENSTGEPLGTGAHALEFRHVGFAYPSGDFALRDLDFAVAPGEHIAIVGENGAGKTTMMKLLLRLYDVKEGEIRIDGHPLSHYDVRSLRKSIGVAFQESHDYALSLRENLRFYADAADETLREALRRAGLDRLEDRLDTDLTKEFDEAGAVLSGGEKQKLALARLFCADLGLLLLDEPSAALDPLAEYELMQSLMTLAEGKTVVMVAHRLSTVRHMDRILVIDHGALAEEGTHEELMARNGIYAEMFRKQGENYVA